MTKKIPFLDLKKVNEPYREAYIQAATQVIDSGWYLNGLQLEKFEHQFARFCQTKHCIGVASGLDALSLTLKAWLHQGKLTPGGEVIVPANTFIASVLAITQNDLTPILLDPDPNTYNLCLKKTKLAITQKTQAIMPVHLYGQMAPMTEIMLLAKQQQLMVLEDAAQAHGASLEQRAAGSWGHAAAFSFYPGKNLGALGDGGAVTTNDTELASLIRQYANYGSKQKYHHTLQGTNSRLDELQAAFLNIKLNHLPQDTQQRQKLAQHYTQGFANLPIQCPLPSTHDQTHVYHLYVIRLKQRDQLKAYLAQQGIQTQIHYPIPIYQQPCYRHRVQGHWPITDKLHQQILSLPLHSAMTKQDVQRIIDTVQAFFSSTKDGS